HLNARFNLLALERADALFEQLAVKFEADRRDVPALLGAEQIARAANFQVAHGDFEPAAQRRVLFDGADPFAGGSQQACMAWQEQISVSLMLVTSHPSAQLVKVAQAEPVRAINDDRVRVRNIEPALD